MLLGLDLSSSLFQMAMQLTQYHHFVLIIRDTPYQISMFACFWTFFRIPLICVYLCASATQFYLQVGHILTSSFTEE